MGLHYLTFMGGNLNNREKLTLVQIVNSVDLYTTNIENSVGIFNDGLSTISN